jgi:hypothetical protein
MYQYILLFIICLIIILLLYIRAKFQFWREQPVFHIYDLHYYFYSYGIIMKELPLANKFCNFTNIECKLGSDLSKENMTELATFISSHYLQNKENQFLPKQENIIPYFTSHNLPCFFTFYWDKELVLPVTDKIEEQIDNICQIIEAKKLSSVMTTRPVNVRIKNGKAEKNNILFPAYYVDYLCVDLAKRKKGIAPQMIQTHEYWQRHKNQNVQVSLFKREDTLTGIVPLTVYSTIIFDMTKWTSPSPMLPIVSLIECGKTNFHYLVDFLKKMDSKFDVVIMTELSNILELIVSKNIFIYFLLKGHEIKSAYFFRKTCAYVNVDKGHEVLSCYGSINNCKKEELFIHGFKSALWLCIKSNTSFTFIAIEDISHNQILIKDLKKKSQPIQSPSPTAYFLYNYISGTFPSNCVLTIT